MIELINATNLQSDDKCQYVFCLPMEHPKPWSRIQASGAHNILVTNRTSTWSWCTQHTHCKYDKHSHWGKEWRWIRANGARGHPLILLITLIGTALAWQIFSRGRKYICKLVIRNLVETWCLRPPSFYACADKHSECFNSSNGKGYVSNCKRDEWYTVFSLPMVGE